MQGSRASCSGGHAFVFFVRFAWRCEKDPPPRCAEAAAKKSKSAFRTGGKRIICSPPERKSSPQRLFLSARHSIIDE